MDCNNPEHDHFEDQDATVRMKCSDCNENLHYDEMTGGYFHDNEEATCFLVKESWKQVENATPCSFDVMDVLHSVLPELDSEVDWSCATARETSDLLNNLRDGFSAFWGVNV